MAKIGEGASKYVFRASSGERLMICLIAGAPKGRRQI